MSPGFLPRAGGISQQSWLSQLEELEAHLARSEADWKLVIGHHPVHSSGHHGSTPELLHTLDPVLRRHGVQVRDLRGNIRALGCAPAWSCFRAGSLSKRCL